MGQLLSKKSREDYYERVLTELQDEIRKRQHSLNRLRLSLRSLQVHLALVSVIVYGCAVAYAFLQYRLGRDGNVGRAVGLVLFPIGAYNVRRGLNWIGGWLVDLRGRQLKDLQQQLKLRLEDLKKETSYYRTRSILERYDESERRQKETEKTEKTPSPKKKSLSKTLPQPAPASSLEFASINRMPFVNSHPGPAFRHPHPPHPHPHPQHQHQPPHPHPLHIRPLPPTQLSSTSSLPLTASPQFKSPSWMDRLMDALIGDDSRNQKYALICQQCCNHNGLAEPEAFFSGIRYVCPNCGFLNAKPPKARPAASEEPRISVEPDDAESTANDNSAPASDSSASTEPKSPVPARKPKKSAKHK